MKKIIWISSYPKSGNTWVRYFLSNYFFNKKKINSSFSVLNNIDKFPPYNYLENIIDKNVVQKNPFFISKYWLQVQSEIMKIDSDFILFKNHNALLTIEDNEFTNEMYSLGAIYIVRDPRDVVVSYSNFLQNLNLNQTLDRVITKNLVCHISKKNFLDIEILGSWKLNYISWRDGISKMPKIIIKYEDLINNTYKTKLKILNFLSKLLDFKVDNDQLQFSINQSKFNRLKKIENIYGFQNNDNKFFNSGRTQQWKKILNKKQIEMIENEFKDEMIELGYLK